MGSYVALRAHWNASATSASATRSVTADTLPGASLVVAPTFLAGASPRGNSLSAVPAGGNHTANYRGCVKWKKARAALAKRAPEQGPKSINTGHPVAPKAQRARPSAEQMDLGEGWCDVVQGGVSSGPRPTQLPTSTGHGGVQVA